MATIQIADDDARVQYTQAVVANTTQLTIDFPFFDLDDLNVIVTDAAGTDTTLSRGTGTGTFAVVGVSVDDGFSGGYVTLGDSYSAGTDTFTIFRDIPVQRTTDFPTSGPFNISSLNTELDKIIAIEQELETKITRTLQLADSDTTVDLKLPNLDTRKGTTLAFNATTGEPEAGPTVAGVTTVGALAADIATLADIEDGTVATDAISDTAAIASDVTAVAAIASDVTAVNANSSNINAAVANAANINAAPANAQLAADWAVKVDGIVDSTDYSSKAWSIGGTGVTSTAGAGPAKDWATETTTTVDGSEYSSKEYAVGTQTRGTTGSAKDWATYTGGTVDGSEYSAKYWAQQAANETQSQRDVYYGAFASDAAAQTYQTVTNGGTVDAGDQYFNTSSNIIRVYDGSAWNDAVVSTTGFATNGFAIAMAIAL